MNFRTWLETTPSSWKERSMVVLMVNLVYKTPGATMATTVTIMATPSTTLLVMTDMASMMWTLEPLWTACWQICRSLHATTSSPRWKNVVAKTWLFDDDDASASSVAMAIHAFVCVG